MAEQKMSRREKVLRLKNLKHKFKKKHLWWATPLAGVFILVIVQIFYSNNLSRPMMKFAGKNIGIISRDEMTGRIKKLFEESKVTLDFDGKKEEFRLVDLGANFKTEDVFDGIFEYSFAERMIPFSLFFSKDLSGISIDFNEEVLNKFVIQYAKDHSVGMKKSSVSINDKGEIIVSSAVDGKKINPDSLKSQIKSIKNIIREDEVIDVKYEATNAGGDKSSHDLKNKIENLVSGGLSFEFEGKTISWDRLKLLSLISINDNTVNVNEDKFKNYWGELNKIFEKPSRPVKVKMVDGLEESREGGENGRRVSYSALKDYIDGYFEGKISDKKFILEMDPIKPDEQKIYSFTHSQRGLQAKVNEIGSRYNVRISLRQLNGNGWRAGFREYESIPSASTYKLYVALKVFEEMEKNNLGFNTPILDTNYAGCFDQMIYHSQNRCAENWINQYTRQEMNNFVHSKGISGGTSFTTGGATHTTAGDLATVVAGIYSGGWAGGNRGFLLDLMARQKWRYGIPTGSKGRVYDKVGFLWDYVHDTAIVEHPRGTYVVAIMTKGSGGYRTIAQITRELEEFMYP